jgi:threonine synthase
MDISKASNFERYVYDLVGRDPAPLRELWRRLDAEGEFDLAGTPYWARVPHTGFVSGRSTHADRLATIKKLYQKHGVMIDPHTADGVKVGLEYREPGVPLVCLETALPAKFAETIRAALGRDPERPAEYAGLEARPQRFELIEPDVEQLKRIIARHGDAA